MGAPPDSLKQRSLERRGMLQAGSLHPVASLLERTGRHFAAYDGEMLLVYRDQRAKPLQVRMVLDAMKDVSEQDGVSLSIVTANR